MRADVRWLVWLPAVAYSIALPVGLSMLLATSAQTALTLNALYSFAVFATNGAFWTACFPGADHDAGDHQSPITLLVGGVVELHRVLCSSAPSAMRSRESAGRSVSADVARHRECLALVVIVTMLLAARYLQRESSLAQTA